MRLSSEAAIRILRRRVFVVTAVFRFPAGRCLLRALRLRLRHFVTMLFLAGPGVAGAESGREWFKLVTPHFEMFSDAQEAEATRLLGELETFRLVVSRFLGLTNVQRQPALVFFFENDEAFRTFKPRYAGKPRPVTGFHVSDPLGDALALSRPAKGATTMSVLFHEYTHLLTARQFRHAPLWASEGVAEVFSTFEGANESFDIGVAMTNHVYFLRENAIMSLPKLLGVDQDSPDYNEQARAGRFYATSWLLTHYLVFGRRGFETNVMARYADLCSATTNQLKAFEQAFGSSAKDLEAPLLKYLRGGNYTLVRQAYPKLDISKPKRLRLARGEVDFALGRLLQLVNQPEPARERLRRAAALAPTDPRPLESMALLAWRQGDRSRLPNQVDAALRAGSRNAFLHFLGAEVRYQQATLKSVPAVRRQGLLDEGRRLCERAIQLDPGLAPAHHLLGIYLLAEDRQAAGLALARVEEALRCDPEYKPALLTWASLAAARGDFAAARRVLATMLAGPLPENLRELANRVAKEIEESARRSESRRPSR